MARLLRSESSLARRQRAIARELAVRRTTRAIVWTAAVTITAWAAVHALRSGSFNGILLVALPIIFAIGYEIRLREIADESRNLEGGRRGEQKMAERLAEQLADDHVILNDLDFRIAHERFQIDHLVIAPSGLYVIESKFWAGTLSGDVRDAQWKQSRGRASPSRSVKSPVQQVERQRRMLIALIPSTVPDDRVHAMAVFTHPNVQLRITGGENSAYLIRDAIRFINDRCFDPPVLSPDAIQSLATDILRRQA